MIDVQIRFRILAILGQLVSKLIYIYLVKKTLEYNLI